jgi:protein-tyrosine phosphatase
MVWQETKEVAVIVMLTQTAESGREKCFQYFPLDADVEDYQIEPLDESNPASRGSVRFIESVMDEASRTTIRKLLLTIGDESRIVWHLLFCGWLDFAIPEGEDQAGLLELLKLSAQKNHAANNPRIIHCSAGVGRSGTFIALDYLLAQLESGAMAETDDREDMVYDVVNRLREQRMTMVQSEAQYYFLHQVLLEQFERWQARRNIEGGSGEPSPKLRKLARGIRSAFAGDDRWEASGPSSEKGKAPLTI